MTAYKTWIFTAVILSVCGLLYAAGFEQPVTKTIPVVSVFDFKETPMTDVLKVFTDLTNQNIVASKNVMNLRITLFLKEITVRDAIKTMCKLYNLWYSDEGTVIRIMNVDDYAKELRIRRDEKTLLYKLKYTSCFAVADLLGSLFVDRITYESPSDYESYGHVGTDTLLEPGEIEDQGGRTRGTRESRSVRRLRGRSSEKIARQTKFPHGSLSPTTLERIDLLEQKEKEKTEDEMKSEINIETFIEASQTSPVITLAIFPRNNAVFVRSVDAKILEEVDRFMKSIDTPTTQVILEVKILEITLTDEFDSFFDFDITPKPDKGKHTWEFGKFTSFDSSTALYKFVDEQLNVRIEMFDKDKRIKVIGTPMILCANNAPGEFFIGEERPIVRGYEHEIGEFAERTTEAIRALSDLREIGTFLVVTPSINTNRTVTMRFFAEISSLNKEGASFSLVTKEGGVVSLPIDTVDTSRVENIIIAKDQNTIAIGGLIRETDSDIEEKVPFLGDIPFLGFFFKKKGIERTKTEIVFLITPHIMMSPQEGQDVSDKAVEALSDHPFIKKKQRRLLDHEEISRKLENIGKEVKKGDEVINFIINK